LFENRIMRADLTGGNIEVLFQGSPVRDPVAVAIDPVHRKIYWAQAYGYTIGRADLSGLNPEVVLEFPDLESPPVALAVDPVAQKVYWAQTSGMAAFDDKILRADVTGTNIEELAGYPDVRDPVALAVDGAGGMVYWAQTSGVGAYDDRIFRMAVTGGGPIELVAVYPLLLDPRALMVVPDQGLLYWAQTSGELLFDDKILSLAQSGGDAVTTVAQWPTLEDPIAIAFTMSTVPIPAASAWGLCVLLLLFLSAGTILLTRHRAAATVAE